MQIEKNLDKIIPELLKTIRNRSSQAQLSRRMGSSTNQVHRWETLASQITWAEFVEMCKIQKVELKRALESQLQYFGKPSDTASLVTHLIGHTSLKDFSAATKFKPSLVSKWKNGKLIPKLSQILLVIERLHSVCFEFIENLMSPRQLSTLKDARHLKKKRRDILSVFPEAGAFIVSTMLSQDKKGLSSHWSNMTRILGIEGDRQKKIVDALVDCGWITKNDKGFEMQNVRFDTRGDTPLNLKQRHYWISKALDLLSQVEDLVFPHRFSFFVIAVSDEADKKVAEAYHQYVNHLKEIVTNDREPRTRLRCVNVQDLWVNFS